MPRYWVGTSGYNYPEWRGSFYPEKHPQKQMLAYYAARLDTVEINYTFYRMPTPRILAGWSAATPDRFRFTLKAPRRITHEARLADCAETARAFCDAAATLEGKLATLLFQLPPFFRKSLDRLASFLDVLPDGAARRSNSGTRRGTRRRLLNAWHHAARRSASPTARSCGRRSR